MMSESSGRKILERSSGADYGHGAVMLLIGAGLVFLPFFTIGWLFWLTPYLAAAAALGLLGRVWRKRHRRPVAFILPAAAAAAAGWLFYHPDWCDTALWYVLGGYFFYSGLLLLKRRRFPRWVWMTAGAACFFMGLVMLLKPGSGLSAAMMIVGVFQMAFGVVLVAAERD